VSGMTVCGPGGEAYVFLVCDRHGSSGSPCSVQSVRSSGVGHVWSGCRAGQIRCISPGFGGGAGLEPTTVGLNAQSAGDADQSASSQSHHDGEDHSLVYLSTAN
jgi:hypothetical protein